jgi:hypothetical protein
MYVIAVLSYCKKVFKSRGGKACGILKNTNYIICHLASITLVSLLLA